jgi:hypothetical protein
VSPSPLFQEELYHFSSPVVVVLPRPWNSYSIEEHILLEKILTSVKIDMNAIHVVSRPSLSLAGLQPFSPARVLIFGSDTHPEIPMYQPTPAQGFIVIKADDLTGLDEGRKKNLWLALRQMFTV